MPVWSLPVPVGGQALLSVQPQFDNPYGVPSPRRPGCECVEPIRLVDRMRPTSPIFSARRTWRSSKGRGVGRPSINARFTDAVLGEVAGTALLDVLEVVSVAVGPAGLSFPAGSTEPLVATATLEGGAQTTRIPFNWWTSDETIATVVEGSVLGTANVAGQDLGSATITAFTSSGPVVTGTMPATSGRAAAGPGTVRLWIENPPETESSPSTRRGIHSSWQRCWLPTTTDSVRRALTMRMRSW